MISTQTKFQFHNGSIKREVFFWYYELSDKFQFHNGSIKSN